MRLTSRATGRLGARALACPLWLALGCGPAVSLDAPSDGSGSPTTSAGPFGPASGDDGDDPMASAGFDGERLDVEAIKLDVAPDLPLPPAVCPPDCQFELEHAWSYDGVAGDPPTPLDPEDQVAVLAEPGGAVVVAEERQGAITLARLDASGQELWTLPLPLPCDPCRLIDLRLHPSGDLLLAARGVDAEASPVAVAARVELDAPELQWATASALVTILGVAPRAGTLVAYDDDLLVQPVIEGSFVDSQERLVLRFYDAVDGAVIVSNPIVTHPITGDAPPPRAAYDDEGLLVVTQPVAADGMDPSGELRWISTLQGTTLAMGERVEPTLRLAAAPGGRILTLGHSPSGGGTLLRLGSGHLGDPEQWTLSHAVETATTSIPALVVDRYGDAHVAVRTGQGEPGREHDVALLVLRWSDQGTLVWTLSLPLALDRVNEPVSMALTPDEDLVLGGFLAGARHVERRIPFCNCG